MLDQFVKATVANLAAKRGRLWIECKKCKVSKTIKSKPNVLLPKCKKCGKVDWDFSYIAMDTLRKKGLA